MRTLLTVVVLIGVAPFIASRMMQEVPTFYVSQSTGGEARPDGRLTPGVSASGVTVAQVCTPGYPSSVRPRGHEWYRLKAEMFRRYGIGPHQHYGWVADHLLPIEIGGAPDDVRNLWPQPYAQAHEKDYYEDALHIEMCDGRISMQDAQRRMVVWPHSLDGIPLDQAEASRLRRMTESTDY